MKKAVISALLTFCLVVMIVFSGAIYLRKAIPDESLLRIFGQELLTEKNTGSSEMEEVQVSEAPYTINSTSSGGRAYHYYDSEDSPISPIGVQYHILSCTYSKTVGELEVPSVFDWERLEFDDNYRMLNDYSYLTLRFTMKNTLDETIDWTLTNYRVVFTDLPLVDGLDRYECEPYLREKGHGDLSVKGYMEYHLEPGEEQSFVLGYFVPDYCLKGGYSAHFFVNEYGAPEMMASEDEYVRIRLVLQKEDES